MSSWYVLDDDNKPKIADYLEAAKWRDANPDRHRVGFTKVGRARVSTIFLSIDHNWEGPPAPPVLFETMVFGGRFDGYQRRHETWEQAEQWHAQVVEALRSGRGLV